jgi:hypothetical protein
VGAGDGSREQRCGKGKRAQFHAGGSLRDRSTTEHPRRLTRPSLEGAAEGLEVGEAQSLGNVDERQRGTEASLERCDVEGTKLTGVDLERAKAPAG